MPVSGRRRYGDYRICRGCSKKKAKKKKSSTKKVARSPRNSESDQPVAQEAQPDAEGSEDAPKNPLPSLNPRRFRNLNPNRTPLMRMPRLVPKNPASEPESKEESEPNPNRTPPMRMPRLFRRTAEDAAEEPASEPESKEDPASKDEEQASKD